MPAFAPMLRPRLGADSRVFVGEVEEGEVVFVEDEVVLVEEAEGLMSKLLLMKLLELCTPMK
jgi:hypothetical protein